MWWIAETIDSPRPRDSLDLDRITRPPGPPSRCQPSSAMKLVRHPVVVGEHAHQPGVRHDHHHRGGRPVLRQRGDVERGQLRVQHAHAWRFPGRTCRPGRPPAAVPAGTAATTRPARSGPASPPAAPWNSGASTTAGICPIRSGITGTRAGVLEVAHGGPVGLGEGGVVPLGPAARPPASSATADSSCRARRGRRRPG